MDMEEIDSTLKEHPRQAKIVLGKAIVSRYYSEEIAREVAEEFDRVFKEHKLPGNIDKLDIKLPPSESGASTNTTHKIWLVKLLVDHGFASTNGEARRLISQGGVSIDNHKYTDPAQEVDIKSGMILKVGKRRFAEIVITQ